MKLNINTGLFETGQASKNSKVSLEVKNGRLTLNLSEGDVFNGKIQDIIGNNVKISLGDGKILYAAMENGIDFNIGERVNFLVKSNDGSRILLQSFHGEAAFNETILNSLKASGITLDNDNINIVKEMMAYGMPIDSGSIGEIERFAALYPDADISHIVSMKIHNIPINQENINQFKAYEAYGHKVSEAIGRLAEEILKLADNGDSNAVKSILDTVKSILSSLTDRQAVENESGRQVSLTHSLDNYANEFKEGVFVLRDKEGTVSIGEAKGMTEGEIVSVEKRVITSNANIEDGNSLTYQKDIAENIQTSDTIAGAVTENMSQSDSIKKVFEGAVKALRENWTVDIKTLAEGSPEEIKKAVKEVYESMLKGTEKIMDTLKGIGMEGTEAYKTAQDLKSNITFMNDLNQMAAYVQIPFKTHNGEADSELYIYSRNKNKTLEDGPITAFLHLDMEYLGATDVKVTMDKSKITTKFTLEDRVSQDIVEQNLPWLKERLEAMGYSAELTIEKAEALENKSPFEKIMEVDRPRKDIKRYSFDIRL